MIRFLFVVFVKVFSSAVWIFLTRYFTVTRCRMCEKEFLEPSFCMLQEILDEVLKGNGRGGEAKGLVWLVEFVMVCMTPVHHGRWKFP